MNFIDQVTTILFGFLQQQQQQQQEQQQEELYNHENKIKNNDDLKHEHFQVTFKEAKQMLLQVFEKDWKEYIPHINPKYQVNNCTYSHLFNKMELFFAMNPPNIKHQLPLLPPKDQINTSPSTTSIRKKLPQLIGISGKKFHGKSTTAQYLCQTYQYHEYAFAGVLKQGVQFLFNLSQEQMENPELKEQTDSRWGVSPRYLLQQIGTNLFRNQLRRYLPHICVIDTFWVDHFSMWYKYMQQVYGSNCKVVISDVRFNDEAQKIKKLGGHLWLIYKTEQKLHTDQSTIHASETQHIICDHMILNDGSFDDLYCAIETCLM